MSGEMWVRAYSSVVWIFHTCAKFSHPAWKFRTCVKNSNYRWIVWNFHIHKSWPWMWKFHTGVWKFHKGCENFTRDVKISHMCEKFKLQMIRVLVTYVVINQSIPHLSKPVRSKPGFKLLEVYINPRNFYGSNTLRLPLLIFKYKNVPPSRRQLFSASGVKRYRRL